MTYEQQEQIKKSLSPNYVGNGFYLNPNPGTGVVETKKLNSFSSFFRTSAFCKNFVSEEGFELSPVDFKWEYIIKFNTKSGFMVMKEYGNEFKSYIKLWIYSYGEDLKPEICILEGFEAKNYNKIISFIKSKRQLLK